MEDLVLEFDVEVTQQKLTKAWGITLVDTMKESLAIVASAINDMNHNISKMGARFDEFENKITSVTGDIKIAKDMAEAARAQLTANTNDITSLHAEVMELKQEYKKFNEMQNEVGALKLECRRLRCENSALKSQANSLETYSRRDNLIIHGIPEPDKESATQCEKSVKQFFVNHLNLTDQESTDIKFIRCHRLHTTRKVSVKPIIIRFKNFQDREKVWTKKTMIKDRKLNIAEDFPKSIAYNRRKLFPVFSKARRIDGIDKRMVSIKGDVLSVRGKKYTVDTLNELNGDLDMKHFNERSDDTTVVMGGMYSNFHPLSNYYPSQLTYQIKKYSSIEQAYQYLKAVMFNDLDAANQIMNSDDAATSKRLSNQIKGFNQELWNGERYEIMTNLIRAKFTQNPALANTLRATGQNKIAESGKHRFFAVGLPITHKDILNQNVWNGESKLGEILMTVRNELNQDQ